MKPNVASSYTLVRNVLLLYVAIKLNFIRLDGVMCIPNTDWSQASTMYSFT